MWTTYFLYESDGTSSFLSPLYQNQFPSILIIILPSAYSWGSSYIVFQVSQTFIGPASLDIKMKQSCPFWAYQYKKPAFLENH